MNRELGKRIARGGTAEVYEWEPGTILKLFHDGFGQGAVEYEARVARAVEAAGLPVPALGEMVQIDGRYGLVYQRVEGLPMPQVFARRPWKLDHYARRMAELHAAMHADPFQGGLPSQRERLRGKIESARGLPDSLRAKALAALARLPDGDRLCHGDFHPENILVSKQGEIIIDWVDATIGSPLADVARTTIILRGAADSGEVKGALLQAVVRRLHAVYLRRYFQLRPGGEDIYRALLPLVAAGRLSENMTAELRAWLTAQVEKIGSYFVAQ